MKLRLFIPLLLLTGLTRAQNSALTLGIGYSTFLFGKYQTFQQFTDSSLSYYGNFITSTDKNFRPASGSAYILSYNSRYFYSAFGIQHHASDFTFDYANGNARRMELSFNETYMSMGFGPGMKKFGAWFRTGFNYTGTTMKGVYIYSNGVESLGQEKFINGVYRCHDLKLHYGAHFRLQLHDGLGVFADVQRLTKFGNSVLKDKHMYQFTVYSKEGIPTDIAGYMADSENYGDERFVRSDYRGFSFTLGLQYTFQK